jgi:hypothetical protein
LASASDNTIMSSSSAIAAPSMVGYGGTYYLCTETQNFPVYTDNNGYRTSCYSASSPTGPFTALPGSNSMLPLEPTGNTGDACPFQFIIGNNLHLWTCHYENATTTWTNQHRVVPLTEPRLTY